MKGVYMYMSFDEYPEESLNKEREACFNAGSNGEKLSQLITDAKGKHAKAVANLEYTLELFADCPPKRRLHGMIPKRLEQERKWVKHFDACINEHKKGEIVAKLKKELAEAKTSSLKREREARAAHEKAMVDQRKANYEEFRKNWEAEQKKKAKEQKQKKGFWSWLFSSKKKEKKQEPAKNPPAELKQPSTGGMSARQKREFYMARRAEQEKKKQNA